MNGEPSESIRDSFNVSSFTDNGTGDFVVNFEIGIAWSISEVKLPFVAN